MKVKCGCKHEFQDKEHGQGVRVATPTQSFPSPNERRYRCTVCLKEHTGKK